jgi:hypothetical protein
MSAVEIPLKRKYRAGGKGKYKSPSNGHAAPARAHRQLTDREKALHLAQPVRVMHLQANGKVRMVTVQR